MKRYIRGVKTVKKGTEERSIEKAVKWNKNSIGEKKKN